jgi:hypothetical protein
MSTKTVWPPDMILRELQSKLQGSTFKMTTGGAPIVHHLGHRILWKDRHARFEVYFGHRDAGNATLTCFDSATALLLFFDGLSKQVAKSVCVSQCPNCGARAVLRDREYIYGANYCGGKMYVCSSYPACDSFVGANPDTLEPLGSLAHQALRDARGAAHAAFDPLWKNKPPSRRLVAYQCAAKVLDVARFHIGFADEAQCVQLI